MGVADKGSVRLNDDVQVKKTVLYSMYRVSHDLQRPRLCLGILQGVSK